MRYLPYLRFKTYQLCNNKVTQATTPYANQERQRGQFLKYFTGGLIL